MKINILLCNGIVYENQNKYYQVTYCVLIHSIFSRNDRESILTSWYPICFKISCDIDIAFLFMKPCRTSLTQLMNVSSVIWRWLHSSKTLCMNICLQYISPLYTPLGSFLISNIDSSQCRSMLATKKRFIPRSNPLCDPIHIVTNLFIKSESHSMSSSVGGIPPW